MCEITRMERRHFVNPFTDVTAELFQTGKASSYLEYVLISMKTNCCFTPEGKGQSQLTAKSIDRWGSW